MRSPSKYPRNHHFSWGDSSGRHPKLIPDLSSLSSLSSPAGPSRPELHRNSAVANPGHGRRDVFALIPGYPMENGPKLRYELPKKKAIWKFHSCGELPSGYVNIAIENGHRNNEFSHEQWWFSIVMLNYQRVPEGIPIFLQYCKIGWFWMILDDSKNMGIPSGNTKNNTV